MLYLFKRVAEDKKEIKVLKQVVDKNNMGIQRDILVAYRQKHRKTTKELILGDGHDYYRGEADGVYGVDGGVLVDGVQTKYGSSTNAGKTVGLLVTKYELNSNGECMPVESLIVTKEEAVSLVMAFGGYNTRVKTQKSVKKGTTGACQYLVPFPTNQGSFIRDDRVIFAYEMSDKGRRVRPEKLDLTEDECSAGMWAYLTADCEKRIGKQLSRQSKEDVKKRQVNKIRVDIKEGRHNIVNPFED